MTLVVAILGALALTGAGTVYALSQRALARTYVVPRPQLHAPTDRAAGARGARHARPQRGAAQRHAAAPGGSGMSMRSCETWVPGGAR
jgi:hypothetical protein